MKPNLEEYLRDAIDKGSVNHTLRPYIDHGVVKFYIYPTNTNGNTLDYSVVNNEIVQLNVTPTEQFEAS